MYSVVLANGDVTARTAMDESVIICDGDVNLTDNHVATSLIVARGNITIKGSVTRSVLMAGGKVTLGEKPDDNGIPAHFTVIKEKEPNTLGVVFFELSAIGVEVKLADSAVRVTAVTEGKPFAKAGIRAGDTISEVNGKKPDSAESLRRVLRDALAVGEATVILHRGEKTETVKVSLPE
jgi:membrane-associated protease RseP (regulator of RpoE activity)